MPSETCEHARGSHDWSWQGRYDARKPMRYVSLHHHSTYSFLDGYQLPDAHVRRATEVGMGALALTEHGNISSHIQLEQAALKEGVKPIFGCEIYMAPPESKRKYHLTVLAQTPEGYSNLMRLVSDAWKNFYYEPTVTWETLRRYRRGLVILSGCTGSLLACHMVGGKDIPEAEASYQRARKTALIFKRTFGENYFLEVQAFPELEKVRQINVAYERLSNELGIPLVATGDCHYTRPSENEMQQILHNVRGGNRQTLEEQARNWGYDVPLSPPASDGYVYRRLRATGLSHTKALEAVATTADIASACTVTLPKLDRLRYPLPRGTAGTSDLWRAWLQEGWAYRGIPQRRNVGDYVRKLKYEINIIEQKDFVDYFLVVSDIVKFAKDSGIPVGPARGSAAASLVCYLLRITEVDPLAFPSLMFERFIDLTRMDLPDIDLDFDSSRRREIWDYAEAKYGPERVGNIGSFVKYKAKVSLDDVARVYRIPQGEVETVKELLIERSSGDLRPSDTIEDTFEQHERAREVVERHPDLAKATLLEGQVKTMGIHAAGLVVANGPLTDVCAVYTRELHKGKGDFVSVISPDKYDADHLNILKIDVLGLSTMTMIRLALDMIGMNLEDLYAIPLDDQAVIAGFQANDVVGVFQFDGRSAKSVNAELKCDNFLEVRDVNALCRPGPYHSGATGEYIDAKWGRKEPRRLHPLLDEICKDTHYQIVYQEQILRIVREIGNFDWTAAAHIRKIISKKLGEQEFQRQWELFWDGARSHGIEESVAKEIWRQCITAGSYAFNVAHSTSYGMLAWWTMWLKIHHPAAFYVASLMAYDEGKRLTLLQDAVKHGITVRPPAPGSGLDWQVVDAHTIQAGFMQIPGVGEVTANNIMEYVAAHGMAHWHDLINVKGIGNKTIQKMVEFCESDDPFEIHKLERRLNAVRRAIAKGSLRGKVPHPTHTAEQIPYTKTDHNVGVVWVGVITARNLRELFEYHFSKHGVELDPADTKDPHLNEWVVMHAMDETESLTVTVNRWDYRKFRKMLWDIKLNEDVVVVRGVKKAGLSMRGIRVFDMWVLR